MGFEILVWIFCILLFIVFAVQITSMWYLKYVYDKYSLNENPTGDSSIWSVTNNVNYYLKSTYVNQEFRIEIKKYFLIRKIRNIFLLAFFTYILMIIILGIYVNAQYS
jgi:ABC-type multidrug transport system fused ATPase/permease subunit